MDVLGVTVNATNLDTAVARIGRFVTDDDRQYVCVTGVHGVMESVRDTSLRDVHNGSGLTTTDGMPLVWCARRAGVRSAERVYGPDLMLAVCASAAQHGWSSYLYGGADGVAERLAAQLVLRFPALKIAGTHSPPFRPLLPEEEEDVVTRINSSGADLVWVGLSTPRQERWMQAMRPRLDASVLLGVGAAFDFHAGLLRQAPPWMRQSGLEWAFRLGVEPRRLWRRYLRNNPEFVVRVLAHPPRLVGVVRSAPGTRHTALRRTLPSAVRGRPPASSTRRGAQ